MAKMKFDFEDEENILRIEGWAKDGLTDKQIAENIGYNETYFSELKGKIPELSEALKKGRAPADIHIENALYKRASGMTVVNQQAFKVKSVTYIDGNRTEIESIEIVEVAQELPPDPTSMIFWLKNRKPEQWNRQPEKIDVTSNGKEITPIKIEVVDNRIKEEIEKLK